MVGINNNQARDLSINTDKIATNILSADATGRAKMTDGFFSADDTGRAKVGSGFVQPYMLDTTYMTKLTEPEILPNSSFFETDEAAPAQVTINNDTAINFENGVDQEAKAFFTISNLYNEAEDVTYTLIISPSLTETGTSFDVSVEYRINGGAIVVAGTTAITPNTNQNSQSESSSILSLDFSTINKNDRITIKIKRLGSSDTHTGDMRVYEIRQKTPI